MDVASGEEARASSLEREEGNVSMAVQCSDSAETAHVAPRFGGSVFLRLLPKQSNL